MFSSISIDKNVKIVVEFIKTYTRNLSSWFGENIRSVSQPVLHHDNNGWQTWMFWCFCLADMINLRTKPKHIHTWCESAHQRENKICFLSKSVMLCKLSHSRNFSYIGVCAQISIRCHYLMWLEKCPDLLLWFEDGVAFVFSVSVGNLGPVRLSRFFRAIPILAYELFDKSYWTVHKYIIRLCRNSFMVIFSDKTVLKIVTMKRSIQLQDKRGCFGDFIFCKTIEITVFVVAITTVFQKSVTDTPEVDKTEFTFINLISVARRRNWSQQKLSRSMTT